MTSILPCTSLWFLCGDYPSFRLMIKFPTISMSKIYIVAVQYIYGITYTFNGLVSEICIICQNVQFTNGERQNNYRASVSLKPINAGLSSGYRIIDITQITIVDYSFHMNDAILNQYNVYCCSTVIYECQLSKVNHARAIDMVSQSSIILASNTQAFCQLLKLMHLYSMFPL